MTGAWGAALLAGGAVGSATAGAWVLWKLAPSAQRVKRRVGHEQVRVPLSRQISPEKLFRIIWAGGGAVGLYLLVTLLTHKAGLAFVVALGGFMIPGWVQEWQETKHLILLSDQLGRVMGMVGTSLRRGTPLEVALAEAALALPAPLGPTLRNMADATVLGVTLSQSVEQVRTLPAVAASPDFQVFATEMVICHQRGANVVQAFEALRTVLAARRKYREQVRENMGQHLLQSLVIASIGLFVLLAYAAMTPDGLGPLLESIVGQMMLAASVLGNMFLIRWTHLSLLKQTRRV
jgi:Flp pilus assembly protein TadB